MVSYGRDKNSFVLLFRQWKLENLCYKSGELVTETHYMDQVRCKCFLLLHFIRWMNPIESRLVQEHDLLYLFVPVANVCQPRCVFVQLDHRKASSLPHHHPFGLFLGGSQAPVWNGLSPVSTQNKNRICVCFFPDAPAQF